MKMILGIYGAGGSGREIYEMIISEEIFRNRWENIVFIDDGAAEVREFNSCKMLSFLRFSENYSHNEAEIIIAVGEPTYRKMLSKRVKEKGYSLATVVSSKAHISPTAHLGDGVIVKMGSIISSDARIDSNVWIASNVIVGHDVHIKEDCQISAMAAIAGHTVVEDTTYIGMSACVREGLVIGHDSIIAMGAVVLKNVRDNKTVIGNPAREIVENTNHKVFK